MGRQNKKRNYGGGGQKDFLKNKRQNKGNEGGDGNEANYTMKEIKLGSAYFDEYYKEMFKSCIPTAEEFELFKNTL